MTSCKDQLAKLSSFVYYSGILNTIMATLFTASIYSNVHSFGQALLSAIEVRRASTVMAGFRQRLKFLPNFSTLIS